MWFQERGLACCYVNKTGTDLLVLELVCGQQQSTHTLMLISTTISQGKFT